MKRLLIIVIISAILANCTLYTMEGNKNLAILDTEEKTAYPFYNELHQAVELSDCMSVWLLLQADEFDVNENDSFGYTPLLKAIANGNLDIVNLLVQKNADPNQVSHIMIERNMQYYTEVTPLYFAILKDNLTIINALLQAGANTNQIVDGQTVFIHAIHNENVDIIKKLIDHNAYLYSAPIGNTTIFDTITDCKNIDEAKKTEIINYILNERNIGRSIKQLMQAIELNAPEDVRTILNAKKFTENNKLNLNTRTKHTKLSPVTLAINNLKDETFNRFDTYKEFNKTYAILKMLLEAGATPNQTVIKETKSPLILAIQKKEPLIVELLLRASADPNKPDFYTLYPLEYAIECYQTNKQVGYNLLKLLLEHGADQDIIKDTNKKTPLHDAIQKKDLPLIQLLAWHSKNINCTDEKGHTPLHCAVMTQDPQIVSALLHFSQALPNPYLKNIKNKNPRDLALSQEIVEFLKNYEKYFATQHPQNDVNLDRMLGSLYINGLQ